jgi:prepilin-type N-terminal cleavage/methylation domain-containing protein
MLSRNRQKGFTLIELLIVVAIIGIIAALLIPNFLDALQKAKQKRTVADMRNTGTAMFSWLTDQVGAAAAGAISTVKTGDYATWKQTPDELRALLTPRYMQEIPPTDGWKKPFEFYLNDVNPGDVGAMLIRSAGKGGAWDGADYSVTAFDPTDYARDIVWADGLFVRWPQNLKVGAAPAS